MEIFSFGAVPHPPAAGISGKGEVGLEEVKRAKEGSGWAELVALLEEQRIVAMYSVYILLSLKDGKHYTGSTSNLVRRLREHNNGKTESTKRRRPFKLFYQEEFLTREEADARERFLKSGKGREELKLLLSGL